jgi:hypothetical protein
MKFTTVDFTSEPHVLVAESESEFDPFCKASAAVRVPFTKVKGLPMPLTNKES